MIKSKGLGFKTVQFELQLDGRRTPQKRTNKKEAIDLARRMVKKYPGKVVRIVQVIKEYSIVNFSILFLILLTGCGPCRHPKQILCNNLPEGVVVDKTYYGLGGWGYFEIYKDGSSATHDISGSYWFEQIRIGDTIINKK